MTREAITIAICTFRRAGVLAQTLASLTAAARPGVPWDVLVVDNGCEQQVAELVHSFHGRLPIRYQQEPAVGIARARNRAVTCTTAPVILFTDDDVTFEPQWLTHMVGSVSEHHDCLFWGGRIVDDWPAPPPKWFDVARCPSLGDTVVRYDLGPAARYWNPRHDPAFYTANLALRTEAVRQAGMFDVGLGHRGIQRGGGEDSWMVRSLAAGGGRGWYVPDAVVHHPVDMNRVRKAYARRFAWRQGAITMAMLRHERDLTGQTGVPPWALRLAGEGVLRGVGQLLAGLGRCDPGQRFAGQYAALFNLSKLWHALKKG